jgi:predicted nucleotidyltransferase
MTIMRKIEAIEKLKSQADAIRALGATSLYLFGSVARDEAGPASDLDLFIDYDPASRFNAFDLVGIKLFLEDELHLPVDVTTRHSLHPFLKDRIETSALQVF